MPPASLEGRAKSFLSRVRIAAARDPSLRSSPHIVEKLAGDRSRSVRHVLAGNAAIESSPAAIERLAGDRDWSVRAALAENHAIGARPHVVDRLARDEISIVRRQVAGNPAVSASPRAVWRLLHDEHPSVRGRIVRNPVVGFFPDILRQMDRFDGRGTVFGPDDNPLFEHFAELAACPPGDVLFEDGGRPCHGPSLQAIEQIAWVQDPAVQQALLGSPVVPDRVKVVVALMR